MTGKWIPKVRICANDSKGRSKHGTKFGKFYAPVAPISSIRIFISMALYFDTQIRQMDITAAFIYGSLPDPIYLELPKGHPRKDGNKFVWLSQTSIYGLRQAPKIWYETLAIALKSMDLLPLPHENCIFFNEGRLLVVIYVDDILYVGKDSEMERFERELSERFKLKSVVCADLYVGIKIEQHPGKIFIQQTSKILSACEQHDVTTGRIKLTLPVTGDDKNDDSKILYNVTPYQQITGFLTYIAGASRPDIAYATQWLATRNKNPSEYMMECARKVLRYLLDTSELKMKLEKLSETRNILKMYCDSSHGNAKDMKSIFGYLIFLNNNVIAYKSKKESIVTSHSTEAEYVALSEAIKKFKEVYNILMEMKLKFQCYIFSDNQAAIRQVKNSTFFTKNRHVDIRLAFNRQELLATGAELSYVTTDENLADAFTKICGRKVLNKLKKSVFM
eukprot:snap_masked-scaffold_29-processed-gene-2.51-mRNA-1 protein AED:0.38 eAED:0.38 QI:0/-1/0/1/-1/1/1/0/447